MINELSILQSSFFTDNSFSCLRQEIFRSGINPQDKYEPYIHNWHRSFYRMYSLQFGAPDLYIRHAQIVLLTIWALEQHGLIPEFHIIKDMFGWVFDNNSVVEELKTQYFNSSSPDAQQLQTFYPELVSPQTRHALGEIYTPIELASLVLQHTLKLNPEPDWKFLDPACGSGTFFIALMNILSKNNTYSRADITKCLKNFVGIDVNPLSVFTCKANLQIFCKRFALPPPSSQNIFLADPLINAIPDTLAARFNCIIGNPPWYNLAAVQNREYQERLKALARQLGINPSNSANIPNIEVASLFLRRMTQDFLAPGGRIAFLLPRNILKGSQNGRVRYFHNLTDVQVWDFGQVPFFPVEFIAFFGKESRDIVKAEPPDFRVQYRRVWSQKNDREGIWNFSFQREQPYSPSFIDLKNGNIGRLVSHKILRQIPPLSGSLYLQKFHNGARLGPRSFLFIIQEESDGEYVKIRPDPEEVATSHGRWKFAPYENARVHRKNLFQCVMSKFLFPFYVGGTKTLFLPTDAMLKFPPNPADPLSEVHYTLLSEKYLKTKKNDARQETLWDYISYNGKTTNPLQTHPLKVIYNAIGRKRVKAAVLHASILVDDSLYYFTPESEAEAYYLAAVLNSNLVSFAVVNIKDERNIHKNPWRLPIPIWQDTPVQQKICLMGRSMENIIRENLSRVPREQSKKELEAEIFRWIEPDLYQLDLLIKQLFAMERR